MPHAFNADVRIHYSLQGEGPPLVLHHGTGSNSTTWLRHGYARVLRERFQLILIDARGHGQSDKPRDPAAHTGELRARDVTAVLDALHVDRAHFLGYSMGGWIGFAMARFAPERLRSLAIGGAHPFADEAITRIPEQAAHDPATFIATLEQVMGERLSTETQRLLLMNDLVAVIASLRQRVPLEDVLPRLPVPCWLFAGTADRRYELIQRTQAALPGTKLLSLPSCSHLQALASTDQVLPELFKFLDRIP